MNGDRHPHRDLWRGNIEAGEITHCPGRIAQLQHAVPNEQAAHQKPRQRGQVSWVTCAVVDVVDYIVVAMARLRQVCLPIAGQRLDTRRRSVTQIGTWSGDGTMFRGAVPRNTQLELAASNETAGESDALS